MTLWGWGAAKPGEEGVAATSRRRSRAQTTMYTDEGTKKRRVLVGGISLVAWQPVAVAWQRGVADANEARQRQTKELME
jgi:hypothetical protein